MVDITTLTKAEIIERVKWKCPLPGHSKHDGMAHPRCWDKHKQVKGERIGFFDIEAEDLNADYGVMFSYCILDEKGKLYSDMLTLDDIKKYSSRERDTQPKEDTRILKSLVRDFQNFDRVVGHYSCGYDLPFVRTRAVICGVDFPTYGTLYQGDTWVILKKKFKLSRNSLMNSTLKLIGKTRKDHLSLSLKHGVLRGETWAQKITFEHCKKDVLDTRDLYYKIHMYMRKTNTSI